MRKAREAIIEDLFPAYVKEFFGNLYADRSDYPSWAVGALKGVGIDLLEI
jgi:queuine tRNA-ribosyltransferase